MDCGKMGKPLGPPLGNSNAMRHGRRSSRPGTVLSRLGPKYAQPYQDALHLRREAETLLKRKYGGVSLLRAAMLQSVCRAELSARMLEQSIRENPDMGTEELRSARACVMQWTQTRDNLLAKLDLDEHMGSPWDATNAQGEQPEGDAEAATANSDQDESRALWDAYDELEHRRRASEEKG